MKILNSAVSMAATSRQTVSISKQSNLEYWVGDRNQGSRNANGGQLDKAEFSAMARKLSQRASLEAAAKQAAASPAEKANSSEATGFTDKDLITIDLIEQFMYRLTGKRFKIHIMKDLRIKNNAGYSGIPAESPAATAAEQAPQRAGYGLIFDSSEKYVEQQSMAFNAGGTVQTDDGRTIDFTVSVSMSREFQSSNEIQLRAGDARQVDPLVINVGGGAPELSQRDFAFDLDSDGEMEQISNLLTGSGFLAFDKNSDGVISDGSELFGPATGSGFGELAQYDADNNGWIDESDPVFDKLRIWMSDGQGNMQLMALGEQGIGALYLGNVASAFDIKDGQNNSLGTVQSSGIFLMEDGGAGTMQHVDLTV